MHFTALTTLSLSALTTALPAVPALPAPTSIRAATFPAAPLAIRTDGRAATIYKTANLAGDSTFLPADNYCVDVSNIYGGFDGEIKSLSVEKGFKCDFYQ